MIGEKLSIRLFSLIYIQWEFFVASNSMIDDIDNWSMSQLKAATEGFR